MLYQKILKKAHSLQNQVLLLQEEIAALPEGKLICCHGNNCIKWYQSNGHTKVYLPKVKHALAEQLARKKYLSLLLKDLLQEKKALEAYLKHAKPDTSFAEQLLTENPGYRELLNSHFMPQSEELSAWIQAPYKHNPKYPEHLIHPTSSGIFVRSKSESMIAHMLYENHIPFRYECALQLGSVTVYPDFTILHPHTREVYYWEHFGRMDHSGYANHSCTKFQLYISSGIIPTIGLITTYETLEHPLTYDTIRRNIENYFL